MVSWLMMAVIVTLLVEFVCGYLMGFAAYSAGQDYEKIMLFSVVVFTAVGLTVPLTFWGFMAVVFITVGYFTGYEITGLK